MLIHTSKLLLISVVEPEPPGAATFRVEPEPIFISPELRAGAAFFQGLWLRLHLFGEKKKESLVLFTKLDLKAVYCITVNVIQKKLH